MRRHEYQSFIAALLARVPEFHAAGMTVFDPERPANGSGIAIDEEYLPKVPGREEALASLGLFIVVHTSYLEGEADVAPNGTASEESMIDVSVVENGKLNRSSSGTGIPIERAVDLIKEHVTGQPAGSNSKFRVKSSTRYEPENGVMMETVVFQRPYVTRPFVP